MYKCFHCRKQVKTWPGADPTCAFATGVFSSDGWMCATASKLRLIAQDLAQSRGLPRKVAVGYTSDTDQNNYLLDTGFMDDPETTPICLHIGWYKSRPRTENMWLIFDNLSPRAPTEQECLTILEHYEKKLGITV